MAQTIITEGALQKSAKQFQKQLLLLPVIAAEATLQHMTGRPGIAGDYVLGQLGGEFQIAPYKNNRKTAADLKITPRTLSTYLGNCASQFAPNDVWDTIYGSLVVRGEQLKEGEMPRQVLEYATAQLGKRLNMSIWNAVRNAEGDTTKDLFDGFDTITQKEITDAKISTADGNLVEMTTITEQNAMDQLMALYESASDELQEQKTKLFLPRDVYNKYCKDYAATRGMAPYNKEYEKVYLEGSAGMCELVPLASKKGSKFLHLTTQANMLYGYGAGLEKESIGIGKYDPWLVTLEAAMYFGVQFQSISPEFLLVGKLP